MSSKRTSKQPPEKRLKDAVIQLRIPADQKQALSDAAAREGLELSAWLRQVALRAAGVLPPSSDRTHKGR